MRVGNNACGSRRPQPGRCRARSPRARQTSSPPRAAAGAVAGGVIHSS
ncbi:hypothetical protein [Lysobacter gummosus]